MSRKAMFLTAAVVSGLMLGLVATQPTSAQGPTVPRPPFPMIAGALPTECSTTDYTGIAAKALGMTAPDLRVALISGKTVQDLASSKNVTMQTITDALSQAFKADLDQAVKDGLLTQQQADAITSRMNAM